MGKQELLPGVESHEYRCILADPPWLERGAGKVKRGADRHYPLMSVREIYGAIRGSGMFRPAGHAHLWLWVTDNFLPDGLWLVEQLGFRYVRTAAWFKTSAPDSSRPGATERLRVGIGQYLRGSHELLLFAVKGNGMDPSVYTGRRDLRSAFLAPLEVDDTGRVVHSRKPEQSYRLIEQRSHGPRLELFGRRNRPGWDTWGNDPSLEQAPQRGV